MSFMLVPAESFHIPTYQLYLDQNVMVFERSKCFVFSQISNMSILGILGPAGEKPVLKYKSCMKYGAFNNNPTFPLTRYLTCPGTP